MLLKFTHLKNPPPSRVTLRVVAVAQLLIILLKFTHLGNPPQSHITLRVVTGARILLSISQSSPVSRNFAHSHGRADMTFYQSVNLKMTGCG